MSLAQALVGVARTLAGSADAEAERRRAVSTAYYALFHGLVGAAADRLVGAEWRDTPAYGLIYRAYDHKRIRSACGEILKPNWPGKVRAHFNRDRLSSPLTAVADAFVALQAARHLADYSPVDSFTSADAATYVDMAEVALEALADAVDPERADFLTFLLQAPRD